MPETLRAAGVGDLRFDEDLSGGCKVGVEEALVGEGGARGGVGVLEDGDDLAGCDGDGDAEAGGGGVASGVGPRRTRQSSCQGRRCRRTRGLRSG